jgi:hypothetical protein
MEPRPPVARLLAVLNSLDRYGFPQYCSPPQNVGEGKALDVIKSLPEWLFS